jgi:hypothetical protein
MCDVYALYIAPLFQLTKLTLYKAYKVNHRDNLECLYILSVHIYCVITTKVCDLLPKRPVFSGGRTWKEIIDKFQAHT